MFFKSNLPLETEIQFSNGNRGVLKRICGGFLTFGRVDRNGLEIVERSHFSTFKQKVFSISKDSLNQLIENGDIKL